MSGHSKWSTIKRKKGAADAKRGKVFTKVIKEITIAARLGGGDPAGNPRLRNAIDLAKSNNMPASNIDRAIKKGTGELEGVLYEELLYEGVGPGGTLFLLEVMTDNRNRTAPEIRKIFDKYGGQLGASGSASWAFDQKGTIKLPREAATEEALFEVSGAAGAEDLVEDGDHWLVTTPRDAMDVVRDALEGAGYRELQTRLAQIPKTPKLADDADAEKLVGLFETLDDHDDIQSVFTDFELSESALARLDA
ncbi:MAG: YebC/PmpR family DNA-binding transcriptional regulator [Myxococcota bacterium]